MLWITLLLTVLLVGAALAFTIWPLVSQKAPQLAVEDDRLADLLARKDTALRAIKDLEFDHQVGKIGDEDFARFQERLNRQAVGLLQQIEKLSPAVSAQLDDQLEAEIAKLRRVQATTRTAATVAATAPLSAAATAPTNGKIPVGAAAHFCTECGTALNPSFKFCANCGAPVAQVAVEQEN
jgi:biopolymer transport protein ExbB/TolQ